MAFSCGEPNITLHMNSRRGIKGKIVGTLRGEAWKDSQEGGWALSVGGYKEDLLRKVEGESILERAWHVQRQADRTAWVEGQNSGET